MPPPVPPSPPSGLPMPQPGVMVSPGAMSAPPGSHASIPLPPRDSAPAVPPAPDEPAKRSLLSAISPGPAAQRREAPPAEPRGPSERARRFSDQPIQSTTPASALSPNAFAPSSVTPPATPPARAKSSTLPPATPPMRSGAPSTPPPLGAAQRAPTQPSEPPPVRSPLPPPSQLPSSGFSDDFNTVTEAQAFGIEATTSRPAALTPTGAEPPPTRIHRSEALADRPFTPPAVNPVPEIPEPGLYNAARYTVRFVHARFQRRGAIRTLQAEIKQDTDALDQVLGALGRVARTARVEGRVFSAENAAINTAEDRIGALQKESGDVDGRKAEENSRFVDVERERNAKLSEAERMVDEVTKELAQLEGQRRSLRDKRKELERRQKAYLKSAEDNDRQAGSAQMGDSRQELRRGAEQYRKEAAVLEPDRQEVDRRLAGLERPIGEATAKLDAAKAELDAAKRSLSDAREGHNHRLAELDAEQKRKSREIAQAEGEIARRLVTLGTLVNLNRVDDPAYTELYQRIDRLRGAITARTTEIEKLTAEREAYDRGSLVRGAAAMGGAFVAFLALIVIVRAILF